MHFLLLATLLTLQLVSAFIAPSPAVSPFVAPSPVGTITTRDELDAAVASAKAANSLLLVKFFAPWCRSCKSIKPRFEALASKSPHSFTEICFTASRQLCRELVIEMLPTVFIYANGELQARPQISLRRWRALLQEIERCEPLARENAAYVPLNICSSSSSACEQTAEFDRLLGRVLGDYSWVGCGGVGGSFDDDEHEGQPRAAAPAAVDPAPPAGFE